MVLDTLSETGNRGLDVKQLKTVEHKRTAGPTFAQKWGLEEDYSALRLEAEGQTNSAELLKSHFLLKTVFPDRFKPLDTNRDLSFFWDLQAENVLYAKRPDEAEKAMITKLIDPARFSRKVDMDRKVPGTHSENPDTPWEILTDVMLRKGWPMNSPNPYQSMTIAAALKVIDPERFKALDLKRNTTFINSAIAELKGNGPVVFSPQRGMMAGQMKFVMPEIDINYEGYVQGILDWLAQSKKESPLKFNEDFNRLALPLMFLTAKKIDRTPDGGLEFLLKDPEGTNIASPTPPQLAERDF